MYRGFQNTEPPEPPPGYGPAGSQIFALHHYSNSTGAQIQEFKRGGGGGGESAKVGGPLAPDSRKVEVRNHSLGGGGGGGGGQ